LSSLSIEQSAAELLRFKDWKFGGCPPSWILPEVGVNNNSAISCSHRAPGYQISAQSGAAYMMCIFYICYCTSFFNFQKKCGNDVKKCWSYCRRVGRYINKMYGPGTGHIWLDNVHCSGTESDIALCSHSAWGDVNCSHSEDVSVSCVLPALPSKLIHNTLRQFHAFIGCVAQR